MEWVSRDGGAVCEGERGDGGGEGDGEREGKE
jgi:hypothetical protein